jgi:hypothetical protein
MTPPEPRCSTLTTHGLQCQSPGRWVLWSVRTWEVIGGPYCWIHARQWQRVKGGEIRERVRVDA